MSDTEGQPKTETVADGSRGPDRGDRAVFFLTTPIQHRSPERSRFLEPANRSQRVQFDAKPIRSFARFPRQRELERMGHPATARRRQRGTVLPYVALALPLMLAMLALSISTGQALLAKDQLQVTADAAARTAVTAIRQGGTRVNARGVARIVARDTEAFEDGTEFVDESIDFGDWNIKHEIFTKDGTTYSPAARARLAW